MKKYITLIIAVITSLLLTAQELHTGTNLLDNGWHFHRGGAQGADNPDFDDSAWRTVDLPHDWSIENLPGTDSPFNRDAISQVSGGFTTGGTGWYRKSFSLPSVMAGRSVFLQFDGVYMNPEIWINGTSVGSHPYGYTSFWYDITGLLNPGKKNIIAVKVRNEGENSRWYSGSGIYRHVWLRILDPVHVRPWGIHITTPVVSTGEAKVNVKTLIQNQTGSEAEIKVVTVIMDNQGQEAGETVSGKVVDGGDDSEFAGETVIKNPALWSPDSPALYTAVTRVYSSGMLTDSVKTVFGIRTIHFDSRVGFLLNGMEVKLKGGCFHDDNGPLGSRSFDRAEERRAALMKASGFNAVRCSHNPPAPAFLDACDRLGLMVIDETFDMWRNGKNGNDYHLYFSKWWKRDVASMIDRDFNHPSVILWSIGNEIPGMNTPAVVNTAKELSSFVRSEDPSRPVTAAVNGLGPEKDPFFATLDVAGYNYGSGGDHMKGNIFDEDHRRVPDRVMIQTESYPLEAFRSWMDVIDHPWLAGDFVWTGVDYIGEASIGWRGYWQKQDFFPWNLAFCGDIDICGWKRPQSYYRDVLWKENQVFLFVKPPVPSFPENPEKMSWSKWNWDDVAADWNWKGYENSILEVTAYSSCDEAELFLNSKSLGRRKTGRSSGFKAEWEVPYQPGELSVVGYSGGRKVATDILHTAAEPVTIQLSADRDTIKAGGQDLCYITIELLDSNGYRNPKSENSLSFETEGPASLAGTGNANPVSLESYTEPSREAWQGRCLVILRSGKEPGTIILKVTSPGLKTAFLSVQTK